MEAELLDFARHWDSHILWIVTQGIFIAALVFTVLALDNE
jgi:hypothetical protein